MNKQLLRRAVREQEELNGYEPMKAVLWDKPFSDPDWIFERKLDGVRCIAHRDGAGVRLFSRTDRYMNADYPGLVAALASQTPPTS